MRIDLLVHPSDIVPFAVFVARFWENGKLRIAESSVKCNAVRVRRGDADIEIDHSHLPQLFFQTRIQ